MISLMRWSSAEALDCDMPASGDGLLLLRSLCTRTLRTASLPPSLNGSCASDITAMLGGANA